MTALAMIIGMVPMALGLGEGGEQNAPLGRAVIGGLIFATVATLFFVPDGVLASFTARRSERQCPTAPTEPTTGPRTRADPRTRRVRADTRGRCVSSSRPGAS